MELLSPFCRARSYARSLGLDLLPHGTLCRELGGPLLEPLAQRLRSAAGPMDAVGFWSGTIIAYEARGKPLGKLIVMGGRPSWEFEVPQDMVGGRGLLLIADPGAYSMEVSDSSVRVCDCSPRTVERPAGSGWYLDEGGLPLPGARKPNEGIYFYLAGSHVGPTACMVTFMTDGRVATYSVSLEMRPTYPLGSLVMERHA